MHDDAPCRGDVGAPGLDHRVTRLSSFAAGLSVCTHPHTLVDCTLKLGKGTQNGMRSAISVAS